MGNVELIALTGSLFHAQTNGLFHIIEELLPKCEEDPKLASRSRGIAISISPCVPLSFLRLVQGIHNIFILSTLIMGIGLVALFSLKEIELRGARSPKEETLANVAYIEPPEAESVTANF